MSKAKKEEAQGTTEVKEPIVIHTADRIGGATFWRLIALAGLGATLYNAVATRYNPYFIGFGILLCLIFGWLYKHFLRALLGLFNPAVKKAGAKKSIHHAVDNSMLFLIPFAVMSLIATYYLKWTLTTAFLSSGIMSVGTAAAIEVGKLRDKPAIRNTLVCSGISFLFTFGLTISVQLLGKFPGMLEALVKLGLSMVTKGGSLL